MLLYHPLLIPTQPQNIAVKQPKFPHYEWWTTYGERKNTNGQPTVTMQNNTCGVRMNNGWFRHVAKTNPTVNCPPYAHVIVKSVGSQILGLLANTLQHCQKLMLF